jgi:glutamyl-tRNA reductase
VIKRDVVARAATARDGRTLVLVDLAVPADVDRAAGEIEASASSTSTICAWGSTTRWRPRPRDPEGRGHRRGRGRGLRAPLSRARGGPLLSELRRRAETIRAREVERALQGLGDVDLAVAERMEHLSRSLVKKLLHDPTVRARERAGAGEVEEVADAVRDLFGISNTSDP